MKGYTDVTDFTTAILEQVGLALITGAGFGALENVRLSCHRLDTLKEAIRRLHQFMENQNLVILTKILYRKSRDFSSRTQLSQSIYGKIAGNDVFGQVK